MKYLIASLLTLTLTACGSITYLPTSGMRAEAARANTATVLLSTGSLKTCVSTATQLQIVRKGTAINQAVLGLPVDSYAIKSHFTDRVGFVHSISLEPGQYQLFQYIMNPYYSSPATPVAEINVPAVGTYYLGELFMPKACSGDISVQVSDKFDRDIAKLKELGTVIAPESVQRLVN